MQLSFQLWFQTELKKTLIQEDLYKTRFGSKYAEYQFQDEVMTAIICLVIKNDFFLSIRTKKKFMQTIKTEKMSKCPFQKNNLAFCPIFQIN